MYFDWGMKGRLEEQIKAASKDGEHLREVIEKLQVDLSKITAEKIQQSIQKNVDDAEKALYKLMDAKEKVDKALSRNMAMRNDGFLGMDESKLLQVSARLDEIINKVMNVGAEAAFSKTSVKDMLSALSTDIALKDARSATSVMDKGLDKQIKERAKAQKEAIKDIESAFADSDKAAKNNVKNQELVKDAIAKIATARANLSAASEKGNQQEVAHAQLLMNLLDRLAGKLNALKGQFLGEKGALDGVLGSGYQGLMRNVSQAVRDIGKVESSVAQGPVNLLAGKDADFKRIQDITAEMTTIQQKLRELKAEESKGVFSPKDVELLKQRYEALRTELESVRQSLRQIGEMSNVYGGIGHLRGYTGPQSAMSDDAWAAAKREAEIREVAAQAAQKHARKLVELTEAFDRQAKAEERANQVAQANSEAQARAQEKTISQAKARQQNSQAIRRQAEELVRLRLELLKTQAAELSTLMKNGRGTLSTSQYDQLKEALRGVVHEMTTLRNVMADMSNFSTRDLFGYGRGGQDWSALISNSQQIIGAQQSIRQLSMEEEKFSQAIQRATAELTGQNRVLGDLQMMVQNYLSLWGAKSFIDNIIQIGGQLEMQRMSIGAILGDTAHANDLFEKIKSLAVQSPFGVVELDQYTKQLSAYGFKYNELYDMTKRLADISAGAGTDVSRLALALGHVRAEGALSGYTLRQFAMNNIPMVGELAKKLTEVEGRLVTIAEVRKRVREKLIDYKDVEDVIMRLTDEGGMFHNMQEVVSESVKARFKNLKDSLDIMYGEMAESDLGGELKTVAAVLTELSRHWKELFAVLKAGIVVLGTVRALTFTNRVLLGTEAMAVQRGVDAKLRSDKANIKLASSYRLLTASEKAFNGARGEALILANSLALSEKKLTVEGVARQVALGRLTKAEGLRSITLSTLTAAEKAQGYAVVSNVLTYGRYTGIVNGLTLSLKSLGVALKSLVWNPLTAAFAIAGIGMELWQKNNEEVERATELNDALFNRAVEGIKNIKTMMSETGFSFVIDGQESTFSEIEDLKRGGKFVFTPAAELTTTEMVSAIEKWTEFIKEYSANKNSILNDSYADEAGNVRSLSDLYERLGEKVGETAEAYVWLKQASDAAEFAESATNGGILDGAFDDDLITNINDYADALKDFNDGISKTIMSQRGDYSKILASARKDGLFLRALKSEGIEMDNLSAQLRILVERADEFGNAIELAKDQASSMGLVLDDFDRSLDSYWIWDHTNTDRLVSMRDARKDMEADINAYIRGFKQRIAEAGWDLNDLTESQKQAIALAIAETVAKANKGTEEVRKEVENLMREKFGIELDADTARAIANVVGLKQSLEELVGHDWHIDVKTATDFGDVIKNVRADYKSAQEYFNNVKPLMMKMGIDVSGGMKKLTAGQRKTFIDAWKKDHGEDTTAAEMILNDYDALADKLNDALDFNTATGISLTDPTKENKDNKTDKQLKQWREELKEIKAFWSEYEKFLRYMTSSEAVEEIRRKGLFPSLFKDGQLTMDVSGGLGSALDTLLGKTNGSTTERKAFQVEVKQARAEVDLKDKEETAKNILNQLDEALKEQGRRWDLYKKILEATGSREQAGQIAFGKDLGFKNRAEQLRAEVAAETQQTGKSVDEVLGMDDESLHQLGIFEKAANGIYQKLKLLKEEEQKVKAEEVELFVDALKNAKSLDTELEQIRVRYERTRAAIISQQTGQERDTLIANANKNEAKEVADKQWEYFKKSDDWGRIFGNLDKMTTRTLRGMRDRLEEMAPSLSESVEATKALYEALEKIDKVANGRNPFKTMGDAISRDIGIKGLLNRGVNQYGYRNSEGTYSIDAANARKLGLTVNSSGKYTKGELKDAEKGASEDFNTGIKGLVDDFAALQDALQPVIGLFDALGMTGVSDFLNMGSNALTAAGQMGQGASALLGSAAGPWGAAIGAGLSVVSSLFSMHDASLQKEIEASQARQKEMENLTKNLETALERTLGSIYRTEASEKDLNKLRDYRSKYDKAHNADPTIANWYKFSYGYISEDSKAAIDKALESESYYDTKFAEMNLQRDELNKQLQAEQGKKDSSDTAIEDYKQQIAELEDEIDHFAEDMAESIYGIDVKSWASELGDALFEAWQKGEDGAEAFKKKAREVITDVAKRIAVLSLIETAMEPVLDVVRNEMKRTSGKLDEESVANIAAAMGVVGETLPDAFNKLMDGLDLGLQKAGLGSMKDDAESTTASKVIQGGFTENETGLLLSYINAMRADLSVQRMDVYGIRQLLEGNFSEMPALARAQLQQLQQIAQNTYRNADAADAIYNLLHRLAPDGQKLRVG